MKKQQMSFLWILIPTIIVGLTLGFVLMPDETNSVSSTVIKENDYEDWLTDAEKKELVAEGLRKEILKSEVMRQAETEAILINFPKTNS